MQPLVPLVYHNLPSLIPLHSEEMIFNNTGSVAHIYGLKCLPAESKNTGELPSKKNTDYREKTATWGHGLRKGVRTAGIVSWEKSTRPRQG